MKRHRFALACVLFFTLFFGLTGCGRGGQEPIGGDWRVQRGYSEDYALSDSLTVCFAPLDEGDGWGVYDASDGARIGSLMFTGTENRSNDIGTVQVSDHNGDGVNDIGLEAGGENLLWFGYDPEAIGSWPEDTSGGFYLIGDSAT